VDLKQRLRMKCADSCRMQLDRDPNAAVCIPRLLTTALYEIERPGYFRPEIRESTKGSSHRKRPQ